MRLVFWQNCLSPHQLPYIVKLADDPRVDSVVVAAPESVSGARQEMGWMDRRKQDGAACEIYVAPSAEAVEGLLSQRQSDSWHLFSGIRAFPFVFDALRRSLKYSVKRGLITERPFTYAGRRADGRPLWLHRIRFFLKDRRFSSDISAVFAIGEEAAAYYRSLSKHWQVFPFIYCTEPLQAEQPAGEPSSGPARFVFVGSLTDRKAPLDLLKAMESASAGGRRMRLTFIGDGPQRESLKARVQKNNIRKVRLLGARSSVEVPALLAQNDILVFPSLYDGWGAVVNEALTQGLYVICSDRCGVRELLGDRRRGCVFPAGNPRRLAGVMEDCADRIESIREDRVFRQEWAQGHISGTAVSRYMVDCLAGERSEPVWR